MALVRDSLLYEAPEAWMRDRRPVAEYPSSFSHAVDRAYTATAAGVYLGREVSGGREGNQLTHSIITRTGHRTAPSGRPNSSEHRSGHRSPLPVRRRRSWSRDGSPDGWTSSTSPRRYAAIPTAVCG